MLRVLGTNETQLLSPEQRFEWIDLTGREAQITETEKDGVFSITLDLKPQGAKKTLTQLVVIASVAVAAEVSAKYAEQETLQPTIRAFVKEQITPRVDQIGRYVDRSLEGTRVIDITSLVPIAIKISERVERDDDDEVTSTSVIAEVGDAVYVYSPAGTGVFDKQ